MQVQAIEWYGNHLNSDVDLVVLRAPSGDCLAYIDDEIANDWQRHAAAGTVFQAIVDPDWDDMDPRRVNCRFDVDALGSVPTWRSAEDPGSRMRFVRLA